MQSLDLKLDALACRRRVIDTFFADKSFTPTCPNLQKKRSRQAPATFGGFAPVQTALRRPVRICGRGANEPALRFAIGGNSWLGNHYFIRYLRFVACVICNTDVIKPVCDADRTNGRVSPIPQTLGCAWEGPLFMPQAAVPFSCAIAKVKRPSRSSCGVYPTGPLKREGLPASPLGGNIRIRHQSAYDAGATRRKNR